MKPQEEIRFKTESVSLLNMIIKYWKLLMITGIAAFIISSAISLTITPLFRSTVVLYPTTNVVETRTLFGLQNTANPLFGDETATEKVLQILKSDDIRDYLVRKYDLMNHYGIKEEAKFKYTILDARMKKNIVSRKTQYNSIEISVLDKDPLLAATMANDIASRIDTAFNMIVRDAGRKSMNTITNSYAAQMRIVRALEDSLDIVAGKGSLSSFIEDSKNISSRNSWIYAAGKYSPEFLRLFNMFEAENQNLSAIQGRLTEAKMTTEQNFPYTHIINKADIAEKKALPNRSGIVISATLSTLILVFFILALSEMIVRDEK